MNPVLFWASLLSVLLLGAGLAAALLLDAGYVWLIWQGWEIQTSVAMLLLVLLLLWIALLLGWLLLTVLWRWPTRTRRHQFSQQRQQQHHVLAQMVLAQSIGESAYADQRLAQLDDSAISQLIRQSYGQPIEVASDTHHDIAVLIRARTALQAQQFAAAQPLINCLTHWPEHPQHDLLPSPLRQAYVQHLHAQWAQAQPWQVLATGLFVPTLSVVQWKDWLNALYQQIHQASDATWRLLLGCFDQQASSLKQALAASWLRLLAEHPEGQPRAVQLGIEMFRQQFCPTILYDWLRSARTVAEPAQITAVLHELQARYVGQPALQLAQAYWCAAQHDTAQAAQLIAAWPHPMLTCRWQALCQLDQLVRPSRLAAPLFVFEAIEADL